MLALLLVACGAPPPQVSGVADGRLAPCPATPNCVSSQGDPGDQEHYLAPFPLHGDPATAIDRLAPLVLAMPRTQVVTRDSHYLHATATSLIFRWVDDVELLVDPDAHVVHVRSASRVGRSDLGVNRRRMARLREAWADD